MLFPPFTTSTVPFQAKDCADAKPEVVEVDGDIGDIDEDGLDFEF